MTTTPRSASCSFLVVDDDRLVRSSIRRFFEKRGHTVAEAESVAAAQTVLRSERPDAAVLDFQLPDGDGLDVLRAVRAADPSIPVVMLTAYGSIDLAVRAVKEGAEQFLTKPVELPTLLVLLERLIEQSRDSRSSRASRTRVARDAVDPFLGESPAILRLAQQARRVAESNACVLLQGDSGTGKGVIAGWLHRSGPRAEEAFVDLNCAGLSRDLLESELFGHEKGAFTGAVAAKTGLLEIAHRGTLFLDEVGDADLQVQAKLLKVVEEQRFRRVGDVRDRQVDVRLIAATHHDLKQLVEENLFREDLFYRISAIPLFVPRLRDRGSDLIILARTLLERIAAEMGFPGARLSTDAEAALTSHAWPGNVRELRNALERALLLGNRETVKADDLAEVIRPRTSLRTDTSLSLEQAERQHVEAVLGEAGGDVRQAAKVLGLSRSALYRKIEKHVLPLPKGSS